MNQNDPKTVAKLLRAIANGETAQRNRHDVIFNMAADLLTNEDSCHIHALELELDNERLRNLIMELSRYIVRGRREESLQSQVSKWLHTAFDEKTCSDVRERCDRFLEEALELLQALDYDRSRIPILIDYVYGRSKGEVAQEIGGTSITFAALCDAVGIDLRAAAGKELMRVYKDIDKIRAKQATKADVMGPLP